MLLIIGVLLLLAGGGFYYARQQQLSKALDIKYYETSSIQEITQLYNDLKDTVGIGSYSGNIVELVGIGLSDYPLTAVHSQRPALAYEASVEREYEVTEQERDNEGNYRTVVKRRSETVSQQSEYVVFTLNDGSGSLIKVDMKGARRDFMQSVDRFESEAPRGMNISFGNSSGSRTIGYRYTEKIIPNNAKLYVLGEVNDRSGELMVSKPKEKDKPFIVSTKSEDDLIQTAESNAKWQKIASIVSAIAGVGCIIASFL